MEERKGTVGRVARSAGKSKAVARAGATPRKKAASAKAVREPKATATSIGESDRLAMVQVAAYVRAERRGFAPGHELEDWLAAEAEVDAQLAAMRAAKPRKKAAPKPRAR